MPSDAWPPREFGGFPEASEFMGLATTTISGRAFRPDAGPNRSEPAASGSKARPTRIELRLGSPTDSGRSGRRPGPASTVVPQGHFSTRPCAILPFGARVYYPSKEGPHVGQAGRPDRLSCRRSKPSPIEGGGGQAFNKSIGQCLEAVAWKTDPRGACLRSLPQLAPGWCPGGESGRDPRENRWHRGRLPGVGPG